MKRIDRKKDREKEQLVTRTMAEAIRCSRATAEGTFTLAAYRQAAKRLRGIKPHRNTVRDLLTRREDVVQLSRERFRWETWG